MALLPKPTLLQRATQFQVAVMFSPQEHQGFHRDRVELMFRNPDLDEPFVITRTLCGLVGVGEEYKRLQPTTPYKPRKAVKEWARTSLEGEKPPALANITWKIPLPQAHVSQDVKDALTHREAPEREIDVRQLLPNELDSESYAQKWQILLHVEEEKMRFANLTTPRFTSPLFYPREDLELYDQKDVELTDVSDGSFS